jgi:hypothetical protein
MGVVSSGVEAVHF